MTSAELAGITQLVHQLVLESTVITGAPEGLVIVSLSSGWSSLMLYVLDSSLASVECQVSSEFLVTSPPAYSLKTSSPPGRSSKNVVKSCTLLWCRIDQVLLLWLCFWSSFRVYAWRSLAPQTPASRAELIAAILKPTFRGMNAMYQLLSSITFWEVRL